ncbi:MAG: 3-dehydroquinate dehydratase, partial [Bacteroidales bacterium]|nr:3-dehydroquinate dehydratase [Bacteroidales bacterium]
MRIAIINGPNLNLLGTREEDIYGNRSFEDYLDELAGDYPEVEFSYAQSNLEGEVVNLLQFFARECDAIVMNPAGYSHTSVAIADAVRAIGKPVVEVHISNVHAREPYRHTLLSGAAALGVISGLGLDGYRLAVEH